ncbi:histidine kinase [Paraflavitalea sp. CAU 1676]|uniref:sensor histidine kinase n=1 Tax=Paraflavitalea sp. CAU 1676 TaxID=3032598 RepID=UPI0023DCE176|nr:histidine kinase [Paraflavitalea sp. CAU 1676]MDF2188983.1 histidine kinase [Paraflavitalea sp. CAU 1676]
MRLFGPVFLFTVGALFFRLKLYLDTPTNKLPILVMVALSCGYVGWELSRLTAIYLQARWPGLARIRQRLLILILAIVAISHFGFILRNLVHGALGSYPLVWPTMVDYSSGLGVLIFYATVTLFIYEGGYLWKQWQQTSAEKERLIGSEWQAKFDVLKNQINPHFLFSSLNSLSTLIAEDPVQAERFTNELSKVYRYLLHSNNQDLVTVADELRFIYSYEHLLRIRHGNQFRLMIEVPVSFHQCLVPSLTMQLLVENAVKHNIVSREQPLEVWIKCQDGQFLSVENKLQRRETPMMSSGMGLSHINNKLRLLQLGEAIVEETTLFFKVSVPLVCR